MLISEYSVTLVTKETFRANETVPVDFKTKVSFKLLLQLHRFARAPYTHISSMCVKLNGTTEFLGEKKPRGRYHSLQQIPIFLYTANITCAMLNDFSSIFFFSYFNLIMVFREKEARTNSACAHFCK